MKRLIAGNTSTSKLDHASILIITDNVQDFSFGISTSDNIMGARFSDWTSKQIAELSEEDISGLDVNDPDDLALLIDIFLENSEGRNRLTGLQRNAVEEALNKKLKTGPDYEIDVAKLIKKLKSITRYQLRFDTKIDEGDKNYKLIDKLANDPDQILEVLRSLEVSDFDHRVISGNPITLGSYIYVAKVTRLVETKIKKCKIKKQRIKLHIRLVDKDDESSVIVISFHEDESRK